MSPELHPAAGVWLLALSVLILPGLFSGPSNPLTLVVKFDLFFLVLSGFLVLLSAALDDQLGQQFVYLLLAVAASEAALGLSSIVSYRRWSGFQSMSLIGSLKG